MNGSLNFAPMVKNIIFDLGGVLLDIDYGLTRKAFEALGVDNFNQMYSQFGANKLFENLETGHISPDHFYRHIQSHYPALTSEEIKNAWNAMLLGYRINTIDLLNTLKPNYRIFLLSNTNAIHIADFLEIFKRDTGLTDFDSLFEKAWYSHKIGFRKPYPEAYEYVLKDAALLPEETLFIDDSYPNIETSKSLGIHSFLLPKDMLVGQLFEHGKLKDGVIKE